MAVLVALPVVLVVVSVVATEVGAELEEATPMELRVDVA